MIVFIGLGLISALAASWLALTLLLLIVRPRSASLRDIGRFFPHVLHLLRGLHRDPDVPASVRWRMWVALAYNVQPFTIIPDFVPVIGLADNVVITAWALRSAVRKAGPAALVRHWPGSKDELDVLALLCRLGPLPDGPSGAGSSWTPAADPGRSAAVAPVLGVPFSERTDQHDDPDDQGDTCESSGDDIEIERRDPPARHRG